MLWSLTVFPSAVLSMSIFTNVTCGITKENNIVFLSHPFGSWRLAYSLSAPPLSLR